MTSTTPDFLSAEARQLFVQARAVYLSKVGSTPANEAKFDAFVNNIASNQAVANSFNDAVDTGQLTAIDIIDSSVSLQRDNFFGGNYGARTHPNGKREWVALSLSERLRRGSIVGGTISFSTNTIDLTAPPVGGGAVSVRDQFTQLFIAGHELAHAIYQLDNARRLVEVFSAADTTISNATAAIAKLPSEEAAAATIDVTDLIIGISDVRAYEEGRANIHAFNQLVAQFNNQGIPFGQDQLSAIGQTPFGRYLVQPDPADPTKFILNPNLSVSHSGFIGVTDSNIIAAANANRSYQATFANSIDTHNVTYAVGAFAQLLLHSSNAPIKVDISRLSFGSGVTFQQFITEVGKVLPSGSYKIFDPASMSIKTLNVTRPAGSVVPTVTLTSPPTEGAEDLSELPELLDPIGEAEVDLPNGIRRINVNGRFAYVDRLGRELSLTFDSHGNVLQSRAFDGFSVRTGLPGVTVDVQYKDGRAVDTEIRLIGNPVKVEFSDVGALIGRQLGSRIANGNAFVGIGSSAVLQTLGNNLGDVLDGVIGNQPIDRTVDDAFSTFGPELLTNIKSAGIGALSSYLTAELIKVVGIDGFAGELVNSAGGAVISQILTNLTNIGDIFIENGVEKTTNAFSHINPTLLATTVGSFLGNKLANELIQFDTIGGQIGSAVGSALGVAAAGKLGLLAGGPIGALAAAAAFAFVGNIVGGLIGSIFGGTPRSGADAVWDEDQGRFVVDNVYSRKGGSKETARALATVAADTFNSVLEASGGRLADPKAITAGNYGMRKRDLVYRPTSTRDKHAITYRVSTKNNDNAFQQLTGYGIWQGLTDPDFQIIGGSNYVKRAVYATIETSGMAATSFDQSVLIGNIAAAESYDSYVGNSTLINAIVATEPDSAFAAETALNLARAVELGLHKRHRSDWFGGFEALLEDGFAIATQVDFGFEQDFTSGQIARLIGVGQFVLGDTIDIRGQTTIERAEDENSAQTIDLRTGRLADQTGFVVNGQMRDDVAHSGVDFTAASNVARSIAAGARRGSAQVTAASDALSEAAEQFRVSLGDGAGTYLQRGEADVTIVDASDLAHLMVGRSYAAEADGYLVWRVSLSKAATGAVSLDLALSSDQAEAGVDYTDTLEVSLDGVSGWTAANSVTLAAGATEYFVRVAVTADNTLNPTYNPYEFDAEGQIIPGSGNGEAQYDNVEGNERLVLSASVSAGAALLQNGDQTASGVGTIIDGSNSDPLVWVDDLIIHEGQSANLSVARSRAAATGSSFTYSTQDNRVLEIPVAATVDAGGGDDTVHASNLGDNIFGGEGNDTLYGGRLDDWLLGGDGNDTLNAGAQTGGLGGDGNYLNGGSGDDILIGREGSDWLEGGDGVDAITGGAGGDILAGGAGDGDQLGGGSGDDQYLVRRGDGLDVIDEGAVNAPTTTGSGDAFTQRIAGIELWKDNPLLAGAIRPDWVGSWSGVQSGSTAGGDDSVVFGVGIEIGDIRIERSGTTVAPGNDLIIQVMETVDGVESFSGTQVTLTDWFTDPFKRVEWLKFTDGTEIRIGDVTSFVVGGQGNDVLIGTDGNDFVFGGAGNDRLFLLAGDDIGNGGTGDDMVAGDSGRDLLIGGLGTDELIGGLGEDVLSGDAGRDDLYGGADNDVLSGGRGDGDYVVGGAGDDTFKYSRGDGHDIFADEFVDSWMTVWTESGGWNEAGGFNYDALTGIVTGPGGVVLRTDVGTSGTPEYQWVGRYDFNSDTGVLSVFAPPVDATTTVTNSGTDTIELAPGINIQDVILQRVGDDLVLAISDESEQLNNTLSVRDSITIQDWYLSPGQIERLVFAQTGIFDISASSRTLVAGTDADDGALSAPMQGTSGADWITGASGDDVIAGGIGEDVIAGNSGFDTLRGEIGNDVLYGGTGDDILDGGHGSDILIGGSGQDTASYASASSTVRAYLADTGANTGDASGDEYDGIEDLTGSSGDDVLGGDTGQNVLTGGLGADELMGGTGDDTYVWNIGDGADTITEGQFEIQEAVTTAGVLAAGYAVTIWESVGSAGRGNRYWRLQVQGPDGSIVYDDSTYIFSNKANPPIPSPSAWIQAGWLGGFARTNGQQVTRTYFDPAVDGGSDILEFGANISLSDLSFIRSGDDLIVRYGGSTSSQVTIIGHFTASGLVEEIVLADGQSIALESILAASSNAQVSGTSSDDLLIGRDGNLTDNLAGDAGDDVLVGYAGNDTLSGGDGDDVIEGGAGADTIDGGTNAAGGVGDTARYVRSSAAVSVDLSNTGTQSGGDAQGDTLSGIENLVGSQSGGDTLYGDEGANRIDGLDGDNEIRGRGGADVLIAGDGADLIYGDAGEDNVDAGAGDDTVYGGADNDILVGGEGNDSVWGEAGDDQIIGGDGDDAVLDGGSGNDLILGDAGNDHLVGGTGDDQVIGGSGNDLLQGGADNDTYLFDRHSGTDTIIDSEGVNTIVFDESVTNDQIWLVRIGNDLVIGVIGGDASITINDHFASTPAAVRSISTVTHTIYLDHAAPLITAMTAESTSVPAALPALITDELDAYWHEGHTAAPSADPISLTIAEDSSTGLVGVGAIDHDGNIAGYAIGSAPPNGSVTIDPLTGEFDYTPNADYAGDDSFTVVVSDADGQSAEVAVTVTVTPVNDAPRALGVEGGANLDVAEFAAGSATVAGSVVGQFEATDPEGEALTFSLTNDAGGRFSITATGELRVNDPALLDRESASSHLVEVQVSDINGATAQASFTVNLLDVNEAPDNPTLSSPAGMIDEETSAGAIATFGLSDVDGTTPSLRFVSNPSNMFKIVGNEVHLADGFVPDFESLRGSGYAVSDSDGDGLDEVVITGSVEAFDGQFASGSATSFSLRVEDVNYAPGAPSVAGGASLEVDESAPGSGTVAGSVVGQLTATDIEGEAITFSLLDDADGRFSITANGELRVADPALLDREAASAHVVQVQASDIHGATSQASFTVTLLNVNEAPNGPVMLSSTGMINEGVSGGTVATFALSDVDSSSLSLRFVSIPSSMFKIVANEVQLADGFVPDFETLRAAGFSYSDSDGDGLDEIVLTGSVEAFDGALASGSATSFSLRVEDVNEAPSALNWAPSTSSIAERDRVANATTLPAISLGTLSVTDPDIAGYANGTYSYTVSDSRFEVVGNELRLKQGAALDYEAETSVSLTVTATDATASPFSIQQTVSFAVTNQDDVLEGDANANTLVGQQNRDRLYGYGGADTLDGGTGDDLLDGGAGDDRLIAGAGNDSLYGGDGADTLRGDGGNDQAWGGLGNDVIFGGDGADTLRGEDGHDNLYGGAGADVLDGGAGSDWADYSLLDESTNATAGVTADITNGSANTGVAAGDSYVSIENLRGTSFADSLYGDSNGNTIEGLGGDDFLNGRAGNDILLGGEGDDQIYGLTGDDTLKGDAGNDTLYGGDGNDALYGGAGDDFLYAGKGDDFLDGGAGNDTLYGDQDNDTYIVTRSSGADTIFNYDPSGVDIDVIGFQDSGGAINDDDLWFERVGDDMLISVISTSSSVLIKNWYVESTANDRANYKIDFIIAGQRYSKEIDVEGLVQLMSSHSMPTSLAQRDALLADPTYWTEWAGFWGINQKPTISAISNRSMNEDGTLNIAFNASDDLTAASGIQMTATVISGNSVISNAGLVLGAPDAAGDRSLTINPIANASGTATIRVQATDAGGLSETREFTVTVNPVADTPSISSFTSTPGTSGQAGGIALSLNVNFPDTDGSEVHEVWITGVPSGVTLSAGTFDSATSTWKLTPAQLSGLKVNAPTGWSQDLTLTATARASEAGQTVTSSSATTVVINAPPTGALLSGSVNENASNGTVVGAVAGVDPDGGALTYTLLNSAGGRFSLAANGVLSVANGSLLNYEAATSHTIGVRVTDSFNQSKDVNLSVAVNNVNEANSLPGNYGFNVNENVGVGTHVGTVSATDLDSSSTAFGQQRYYFLNGSSASATSSDGRYRINATTGQITTNTSLNYEAGTPSKAYTVIARDNAGGAGYNQRSSTVTIGINNRNEANSLPSSYSMAVNENVSVGTVVGTVTATDLDSSSSVYGQQRYYFLNGSSASATSSDGRYKIDALTGRITTNTSLNYEAGTPSKAYTVIARDNAGGSGYNQRSSTVTIGINNLNEANNLLSSYSMAVNENVAVGTAVGTVTATDLDSSSTAFGQQRYYFLNGSSASATSSDGRYRINATTGQITTNTSLNYEAGTPSKAYTVIARDNAGGAGYNQRSSTVTIGINNRNEANSLPSSYNMAVNENVSVGTVVGTVTATDLDSSSSVYGQQRYYFLNGSSASATSSDGRYKIDALTGRITTNTSLNYEAGTPSKAYTVIARDNAGGSGYNQRSSTVTIGINNLNETNSLPAQSPMSVAENVAVGTVVGTLAPATDLDSSSTAYGQQRYYFLNGSTASATSSDGRYRINATTGQITTNTSLNYEAGTPSKAYTVIARDNAGAAGYNQRSRSVTISINDVNEPHSLSSGSGGIEENTVYNPLVGGTYFDLGSELQLVDPENGAGLTWTFADGSSVNGIWTIEGTTGKLYLNQAVDYEAITTTTVIDIVWIGGEPVEIPRQVRDHSLATQNLSIKASDGPNTATTTFTASITDKNEGPQLNYSPRYIIRDDQGEGNFATLQGYDPETGAAATTYTITSIVPTESFHSRGSSSDVDNTGNPTLTIGYTTGVLNFQVPGDGEWEGGIKYHPTLGGRWYYQLDYHVTVRMTDSTGQVGEDTFTVTFLKHGTSGVLPVVLDLDGDGIELVDHETSTVMFDMDLDGIADRTGWVAADDGMLVLDRNGNGIIDNALEISFARDDESAVTDLEGLRAWDTNRNGLIDAGDDDFASFQVWQDINQNGVSEVGELFSLTELGIEEINLTLNLTGEELVEDKNVLYATSEFYLHNGQSGLVGDVSLAYDPSKVDLDETGSDEGVLTDPEASSSEENAVSEEEGSGASEATGLAAPIVFDLDGDGAGLVALEGSTTFFDMNGDGFVDQTGWIEDGDAFLVLDRNANGLIDDIAEISFVDDLEGAQTDLEGLAAFDSNGDGFLNGEDDRFVEFRLWRDVNSDGITDAGELLSLAEAGVTSITLTGTPTGETQRAGENVVFNTSTYNLSSGETGTLLDAGIAFNIGDGLPDTEFQRSTWEGKRKRWRISSSGGSARLAPRRALGAINPGAGALAPAAIFEVGGQQFGLMSSIILDLDGDGLEARRLGKSRAKFDMDGDGQADRTGWMSGGDGMLVIDRNGDGLVTDASEFSFLTEKEDAVSAWDGLSELDENNDGIISSLDSRFGELSVWVDANRDGISQGGELMSLVDLGISEISLGQTFTADRAKIGRNLALSTSTFTWANGVTSTIGNIALGFEASLKAEEETEILDGTTSPAVPRLEPTVPGTRPERVYPNDDPRTVALAAANIANAMSQFGGGLAEGELRGERWDRPSNSLDLLAVNAG